MLMKCFNHTLTPPTTSTCFNHTPRQSAPVTSQNLNYDDQARRKLCQDVRPGYLLSAASPPISMTTAEPVRLSAFCSIPAYNHPDSGTGHYQYDSDRIKN